jgi:hypothetical protein
MIKTVRALPQGSLAFRSCAGYGQSNNLQNTVYLKIYMKWLGEDKKISRDYIMKGKMLFS